jgi:OPA family glycerol-3-phosphate transporter-like MFS transporter 1/2
MLTQTGSRKVGDLPNASLDLVSGSSSLRRKLAFLKARVFLLTFVSYAVYTGTRSAFGITKAALHPDNEKNPSATGYAPFNDKEWGSTMLGACDTTFLTAYAIGLFITGPLGDRLNLRWFLGFGMLGAGLFCFGFGFASLVGIHHIAWFLAMNLGAGLFQATGWPGCVTLITRWFGQGNRGTIMGVWNAHGSVGNIVCKLVATALMQRWGWSATFLGLGSLCMATGLLQLAFIIPHPHDVLSPPEMAELARVNASGRVALVAEVHEQKHTRGQRIAGSSGAAATLALGGTPHEDVSIALQQHHSSSSPTAVGQAAAADDPLSPRHHDEYESISFMFALRVPGVLEYSACLFFSKLVAYAFMFWLPYYLSSLNYSDTAAGNISVTFDIGGVAGGILAGSDTNCQHRYTSH